MTIDEIMQGAINEKQKHLDLLREKAEIARKEKYDACVAFLKLIRPLEKYGIKYNVFQRQYNVNSGVEEYGFPRFGWDVALHLKGGIFHRLQCKIIDGVAKAKWENTILWHGAHIEGQDKDGYFTAEQFATYWAKQKVNAM